MKLHLTFLLFSVFTKLSICFSRAKYSCDDCYYTPEKSVVSVSCDDDNDWDQTRTVILLNNDNVLFNSTSDEHSNQVYGTSGEREILLWDNNGHGWSNLICVVKRGNYQSRLEGMTIPVYYGLHLDAPTEIRRKQEFTLGCFNHVAPNVTHDYTFLFDGKEIATLYDGRLTDLNSVAGLKIARDYAFPKNRISITPNADYHFGSYGCKATVSYRLFSQVFQENSYAMTEHFVERIKHDLIDFFTSAYGIGYTIVAVICFIVFIRCCCCCYSCCCE